MVQLAYLKTSVTKDLTQSGLVKSVQMSFLFPAQTLTNETVIIVYSAPGIVSEKRGRRG